MNRYQALFGWLTLALLACFAWRFAAERLYADSAYFLLQVITKCGFHIINGRLAITLYQWLPLVGVELGLPLSCLILLHSMASVVLGLACFLFITRVLKDLDAGTTLVAVLFVGISHAQFCPVFEFYYGAMLLVVFIAVLRSQKPTHSFRFLLLSILFVLVISSHFMGLLVMLLTLTLERVWHDRRLTFWLAFLLILQLSLRFAYLSIYESNALGSLLIRLKVLGAAWIVEPGRILAMAHHALLNYPDTLVLALVATLVMIRLGDRWGLFVLFGGLVVAYVLTSLLLPDTTLSYYREIVDYPLSIFVLLVVSSRVLPSVRYRPLVLGLLGLALCYRVVYTLIVSEAYTQRLTWMEECIRQARTEGIGRAIVLDAPIFKATGHAAAPLNALSPMETLLLSARAGSNAAVALVPLHVSQLSLGISDSLDARMPTYGFNFPVGYRSAYFNLPDEAYRVLE